MASEPLNLKNPAYHIWPQELFDLRVEVEKHPNLKLLLAHQKDKDIYIQLMEIATYCELVVDGDFTQQDILALIKLCTQKLMQKRSILVIPTLQ